MNVYTIASGTATDAYDLSDKLDVFMVNTLGWYRQYTIASGVSEIDRVYHNNGGTDSSYGYIYSRWRGYSDQLFNYAYSYYSSDGLISNGEIGNGITNVNPGTSISGCSYWFIGDLDVVWVLTKHAVSGTYYATSVGYCNTYYCPSFDYLPVYVCGHSYDTQDFSSDRVYMYDSLSGTQVYNSQNTFNLVRYGASQVRDVSYFGMPIGLYNDTPGYYELRGELPGIKQVSGSSFLSEDMLVVSGTGTYTVIKHGNSSSNTMAYGPYS